MSANEVCAVCRPRDVAFDFSETDRREGEKKEPEQEEETEK